MYTAIVKMDGAFYCAIENLSAKSFQEVKCQMMGWMKENPEHLVAVSRITQEEWENTTIC
jgi:acid stress-induced BolA-like protein IbaG/YrbA